MNVMESTDNHIVTNVHDVTESIGSDVINLYDFPEFKVSIWIRLVSLILLLPLATIGNILSFVVLNRKALKQSTTSLLLSGLALADLAVVVLAFLPENVAKISGKYLESTSDFMCKCYFFTRLSLIVISSWILVLVSFERVVALWLPLHAKIVCSRRNAAISMAICCLSSVVFNARYFFTRGIQGDACRPYRQFSDFESTVGPWLIQIAYWVAPSCLLITCNALVIVKLRLLKFNQTEGQRTKIAQNTIVMLLATFCYMVFVSPITMFYVINTTLTSMKDAEKAALELKLSILQQWSYINNAINFLIYVTSGPRFRRELEKLRLTWKPNNQVEPTNSVMTDLENM
jgi:hypothetical protein